LRSSGGRRGNNTEQLKQRSGLLDKADPFTEPVVASGNRKLLPPVLPASISCRSQLIFLASAAKGLRQPARPWLNGRNAVTAKRTGAPLDTVYTPLPVL
jgi:hypothetical protein